MRVEGGEREGGGGGGGGNRRYKTPKYDTKITINKIMLFGS